MLFSRIYFAFHLSMHFLLLTACAHHIPPQSTRPTIDIESLPCKPSCISYHPQPEEPLLEPKPDILLQVSSMGCFHYEHFMFLKQSDTCGLYTFTSLVDDRGSLYVIDCSTLECLIAELESSDLASFEADETVFSTTAMSIHGEWGSTYISKGCYAHRVEPGEYHSFFFSYRLVSDLAYSIQAMCDE